MRIIKINSPQKKESQPQPAPKSRGHLGEPSSLKNRKSYVRRCDLTPSIRLELGIMGLHPCYRSCSIRELKAKYNVSHTFIYEQSNILKKNAFALFGIPISAPTRKLESVLESMRFFLEGKLETKGALHGLSNFGKSLSVRYTSTNFISELIQVAGSLVGSTYVSEKPLLLTFLCDEIYSGSQAILATIEAQSMVVLDISLVEGSLKSSDWEQSFNKLENNKIRPKSVIKDQGPQMASAVKVLPDGTIIGADTFHAIPHRLGVFHSQFKKEMDKAATKETDRAERFSKTKSYPTALKKEAEWEAAKLHVLKSTDEFEWFKHYYFKLIQQLRPFTSQGLPRDKTVAELEMRQALEALSLLCLPKLEQQIAFIKNLLDNGQLLHYIDQVPLLYQQLQGFLDQDTIWLWVLYWQWEKKSYQTHSPKVGARAKQEATAARELLKEYYLQSSQLEECSQFELTKEKAFSVLNEIVQASSLVETFNSILRPFINSAKGQVSQELLNLVMFYHNHRIFKRGKRQHQAPIEILTGQKLQKSWIDLLMQKVEDAFEKYQVTSLKELKQSIEKEKMQSFLPIEQKPPQNQEADIAA